MYGYSVTKRLTVIAALAAVYFGSAQLGLSLASAHHNVSLIWPSTGIALAAVLLLGYWVWPAITLGAFLANAATGVSLFIAGGIAVGNTLEALGGAFLVRRLIGNRNPLDQAQDVFKFVGLAVLLSTMVSATIGTAILCLGMAASWSDYGQLWLAWWLGDAAGALVVTPAVLAWNARRTIARAPRQVAEVALLLVLLTLVSHSVFAGWISVGITNLPLAYLPVPFLIWAAVRFHQRTMTTAILFSSGIAIWGTAHGLGPFARGATLNESLFLLHTFVGITAVMSLVMAAVITERNQAEETQRRSQEQYKLLVEQARDIIYRTDDQGRFTFVNPIVTRIMGYSPQELLGRRFIELIRPDARAAAERFYGWQFVRKTPSTYYEFPTVTKDGAEIWVGQNVQTLVENDRVVGFHAVTRDITERKLAEEKLLLSQEIIANAHDPISIMDLQGRFTYQNPAHASLVGFSDDELLGKTPALLLGDETFAFICRELAKAQSYRGGVIARTKDGGLKDLDLSVFTIRDAADKPVCLVAIKRDITERKRAEERLTRSHDFLKSFVEHTPAAVAMFDKNLRYMAVSRRWLQDYHLGDQDLIGRHHYDVFPEIRQHLDWQNIHQRCLAGAVERREEDRFMREDGNEDWLRWEVRPWHDEVGEIGGIMMFTEVITERKRTEEALRQSEERFRSAFGHAAIGMALVSTDGRWLQVNPTLCDIVGYSEPELLATTFQAITHPDDLDTDLAYVRQMLAGEIRYYQMEKRYIHKRGHMVWILLSVSLVHDREGNPLHFISLIRDITERKRAEETLAASEKRFRTILEAEPECVKVMTEDGVLLDMNAAGLAMIEADSLHQVLGQSVCPLIAPAYRDAFVEFNRRVFRGKPGTMQFEIIGLKGQRRWMDTHAVPLRDEQNTTIGVLAITRDTTERKQAEETLRERARLSSFAAEVSLTLNRETSTDEILHHCVDAAVHHLGAALARIWIVEPGDLCEGCHKAAWCTNRTLCLHLKASAGLSSNLDGEYRRVPLGALKIGRIAQGMGVMVTNDVLGDERLPNKDWLRENGLQSFAGFPLVIEGKVFGVMAVFARVPLSGATLQTLESICNGIAATIARKRAETALRERSRQQTIEAELSLLAVTVPDFHSLLGTTVKLVSNALETNYCEVLELLPNGKDLRLCASAGWRGDRTGQVRAVETGSLVHAALQSSKPVVRTLQDDTRFSGPPWLHEHRAVGGMSVTIHGKETPWGVLGVYTAGTRAFSRDDINFLQTVASILAAAIERVQAESVLKDANQALRLLSRQLLQVQEENRRAIARDLHDEIGQSLTAIKLNVERAQRTSDRDARTRIMQDCAQITERVLGQVRDLSLDLHPSILDDLGLAYALKWYADRQAERAGLKVVVTADPSLPRLSQDIEIACFRIAQEALTNVVRHAQARHADITLKRGTAAVELCIQDDGIGFIVGKASFPANGGASVGLASMQERAKLLGGTVKITSAPHRGTKVIAMLPLVVASPAGMPKEEVPRS